MNTSVKDLMSTPVVTTTIDAHVGYARELMERKDVSAIPVIELGDGHMEIRGILSLYDLSGVVDESIPVTEIMSTTVQVIEPDMSAAEAATVMVNHGIHHLVVMNGGRIVGMLSSLDFVRLISEQNAESAGAAGPAK